MKKEFQGLYTALITPFKNNIPDEQSLLHLIKFQESVDGFVVHGTTGESPTTTDQEKQEIFKFVKANTSKKLIVGTGTYSTDETLKKSEAAQKWGADALLVVVPYYNKPPQKGLIAHFKKIADHSSVPVILYNVPGRTITSLSLESIVELSQHKKIIGIKEASGDLSFAKQIREQTPAHFTLLSGDDGTYLDFLKLGGDGCISVASHLFPEIFSRWTHSPQDEKNNAENAKLKKIIDFLFKEANPIPVKMALYLMGLISSPELRLPLIESSEELRLMIKKELIALELMNEKN